MSLFSFFKKIFGSRNKRLLNNYSDILSSINSLESSICLLSDEQLKEKTSYFRREYQSGKSLDDLLPEAFAVVREASKRVLNMRHFDVQILGGIALHFGKIAEMRTGEGKTLVATLPVYLNSIAKQVHVVTVNDYLASRDAKWMENLYKFLDISVGIVISQQSKTEKKEAYKSDVIYGTNNEFGFDYLRDNMEMNKYDKRQKHLFYAIIDEVDSILIDEARTPLIISGQSEENTEIYYTMNKIPSLLKKMSSEPKKDEIILEGDFWLDEKNNQVYLSETGQIRTEEILIKLKLINENESLYESKNIALMHHLMNSLRAHNLFFKNKHYVIQNKEIVIVDEFTGRLMHGRRWSDGLHQAIEAKEGVQVHCDNRTLASITFQNYFRMYEKLSGMTGTANTEAYEFQEIYGLETVVIPTNKPMIRIDENDQVFRTQKEKISAIINDIKKCYEKGQPVLVGTTSIENSELLSKELKSINLPHNVLNAKQHAKEADIIAEAGKFKHITIATNMAGRGTDIVLGGNIDRQVADIKNDKSLSELEKSKNLKKIYVDYKNSNSQVKKLGGLRVIGTERHESRRIDNQLRGRSGRQGDPGSSRFYLSLEDPLMRIFSGDKISAIMDRLKLPLGEAIESKMINKAIESAQRKVEYFNFDIRKQLLDYDDIDNEQRINLYSQRNEIMESSNNDIRNIIDNIIVNILTNFFNKYINKDDYISNWNLNGFIDEIKMKFNIKLNIKEFFKEKYNLSYENLLSSSINEFKDCYKRKFDQISYDNWSNIERYTFLQVIDSHWREHLSDLDYLRQGIHLRGYAQKNPKQEYKKDAFKLFSDMLDNIFEDLISTLVKLPINNIFENYINNSNVKNMEDDININNKYNQSISNIKIGRNDQCPCKSGKKYKFCHGNLK